MPANVKNAILKKKIDSTIYDLMVKTTWAMVFAGSDDTSLQSYLETLNGADNVVGSYKNYIKTAVLDETTGSGKLGERVKIAEAALALINDADATKAGSMAKLLADAKAYSDGKIGDLTTMDVSYTTVLAALTGVKTELEGKIAGGFHFKGTKDYVSQLPATGSEGDVWQVLYKGESGTVALNAEYAWNGTTWVELGSFVDLSPYALSTDVAAAITTAKETVLGLAAGTTIDSTNNVPGQITTAISNERNDSVEGTLAYRTKAVETRVTTLEGDDTTAGSVAKAIKDKVGVIPSSVGSTTTANAKEYIDAKVAKVADDAAAAYGRFYASASQPADLTENDLWAQIIE